MKDIPVLNTIEDLVAVALKSGDTRYELEDNSVYEYDDPVAGKAWEDNEESVVGEYPGAKSPEYSAYIERERVYRKTKPAMHPETHFYLKKKYIAHYKVGAELGVQIDAVWTKKVGRYSTTPRRTGVLTLAGILKRMGRTDVATKIKDAEIVQKEANAKYRRNNVRVGLQRKLDELEKWVKDYGAEIGVTPEMFQLPVELADALKEEV